MSAEMEKLLRYQGPAFNEFAVSAVTISGEIVAGSDSQIGGQPFVSALSGEQGRVGMFAYNNSDSTSGELYFGSVGVLPSTGFPIPNGSVVEIPFTDDFTVYFACPSGETADLRVLEIM